MRQHEKMKALIVFKLCLRLHTVGPFMEPFDRPKKTLVHWRLAKPGEWRILTSHVCCFTQTFGSC